MAISIIPACVSKLDTRCQVSRAGCNKWYLSKAMQPTGRAGMTALKLVSCKMFYFYSTLRIGMRHVMGALSASGIASSIQGSLDWQAEVRSTLYKEIVLCTNSINRG